MDYESLRVTKCCSVSDGSIPPVELEPTTSLPFGHAEAVDSIVVAEVLYAGITKIYKRKDLISIDW